MAQKAKQLMLAELEGKFRDIRQTGCVLIGYQGLKAAEAMQVRHAVRRHGGELTVVRNALFTLALQRLGAEELNRLVEGPTAVIQAQSPLEAAKAAKEIAQTHKSIQVRGMYAAGAVTGPEGVEKLATLPSREVLLSMVAGALMAPLSRLAGALLAKPRALLSLLGQLRDKGEQKAQ
jgi:large subunit ribosomal protein L10